METIAVIYLMWYPLGFEALKTFISSYKEHNAGLNHELHIILKDFPSGQESDLFIEWLSSQVIQFKYHHFKDGFDIDAYFFVSKKVQVPFLFFFNTNSKILGDDWLKKMYRHLVKDKVGVVAATGSWASYASAVSVNYSWKWEVKKPFIDNLKKYKTLLKNLLYWQWFFRKFPNPHVRTNAFMISRDVFLKVDYSPIKTKFQAYTFESGKNGFSNQLLKLGYKLLVVDRRGNASETQYWNEKNIFWQKDQSDLMIADKQTNNYHIASLKEKKVLSLIAWG